MRVLSQLSKKKEIVFNEIKYHKFIETQVIIFFK